MWSSKGYWATGKGTGRRSGRETTERINQIQNGCPTDRGSPTWSTGQRKQELNSLVHLQFKWFESGIGKGPRAPTRAQTSPPEPGGETQVQPRLPGGRTLSNRAGLGLADSISTEAFHSVQERVSDWFYDQFKMRTRKNVQR